MAVNLFLVRHAKAVDAEGFQRDEERALTRKGRRSALDLGETLKARGVTFDRIVASPLVRAVETAELLAVATGFDDGLIIDPTLGPGATAQAMMARLLTADVRGHALALVGHEPSMGALLSALVGRPSLSLPKMAVVRLDWQPGDRHAAFKWFVTPKQPVPVHDLAEL